MDKGCDGKKHRARQLSRAWAEGIDHKILSGGGDTSQVLKQELVAVEGG